MNFSDIELPSNKKFGIFFGGIFAIISAYFFVKSHVLIGSIFIGLSIIFALLAFTKSEALLPLNKLWMRFGLLLGLIVSPIVLGLIFFLIFMPIGLLMRLFGRDELRLKTKSAASYWKEREPSSSPAADSFKNQF